MDPPVAADPADDACRIAVVEVRILGVRVAADRLALDAVHLPEGGQLVRDHLGRDALRPFRVDGAAVGSGVERLAPDGQVVGLGYGDEGLDPAVLRRVRDTQQCFYLFQCDDHAFTLACLFLRESERPLDTRL